jgi:ubiquinone/menaquinone biosynthesis C-methylase UbiE
VSKTGSGQAGHPFPGDAARLRSPGRVSLLEVDRVVRLSLEGVAIGSVLDVGTGTGLFAEAFAKASAASPLRVAGVDLREDFLALARGHAPGVEFWKAPAEGLPFADGSFDLVFLGHVLHESRDPARALAEARRVARRRVVLLEWPFRREGMGPPLEHRLAPERIAELTRAAGFRALDRIDLRHMVLYRLSAGSSSGL